MKVHEAFKLVIGSSFVYVAMAACSGAGAPGGDADGVGRAVDGLTDPEGAAAAAPHASGSRLKALYYTGADGSKTSTGRVHDTTLDVDCTFRTMSDGQLHCVPDGPPVLFDAWGPGFFADPACSKPVALGARSPCDAFRYITRMDGTACSTITHVFPVAGVSTDKVYLRSGASCEVESQPENENGSESESEPVAAYLLGDELPPGGFVQATVQAEP